MSRTPRASVVVGVDVGGPKKGFHAVALREGHIFETCATLHAMEVVAWCRKLNASVVGIDAPCCWSRTGRARPCALARKILPAKQKRADRPRLLREARLSMAALTNIDMVDAALCALAAHHLLAWTFKTYGDAAEGFIVVPKI